MNMTYNRNKQQQGILQTTQGNARFTHTVLNFTLEQRITQNAQTMHYNTNVKPDKQQALT